MTYLTLKYLHVLGGIVILGTGMGIAFFMLQAHRTGDVSHIFHTARTVVVADFLFTAVAVVVQPITGLLLARQTGLPLTEGWLIASLALYVVAGLFWVPVIFFQVHMRNLAGLAFTQGEPLPEERNRRTAIRFPDNNSASSTN